MSPQHSCADTCQVWSWYVAYTKKHNDDNLKVTEIKRGVLVTLTFGFPHQLTITKVRPRQRLGIVALCWISGRTTDTLTICDEYMRRWTVSWSGEIFDGIHRQVRAVPKYDGDFGNIDRSVVRWHASPTASSVQKLFGSIKLKCILNQTCSLSNAAHLRTFNWRVTVEGLIYQLKQEFGYRIMTVPYSSTIY